MTEKLPMIRSPYGLDIIESCLTCKLHGDYLFCNLSPPALQTLEAIKSTATYPKGAVLFVEGQQPRGVFVLCHGRAKLTASSADGKSLILRIANAGEVLGLSATISGRPYAFNAEVIESCQANFIERKQFLNFLHQHGEAAFRVAEQLSENYHTAFEEVRALSLSHSVSEKVARLLLQWADERGHSEGNGNIHLTQALTHEEIAQLLGTSRETVTRTLADFKKKRLIEIKGSSLIIQKRAELQHLIKS
jgi:CRP/FNR family transcriptional regulator, cyclic AMP receptor protein